MNSGVLFALLLCLSCGLWIRAEVPENKGLLDKRPLAHRSSFHQCQHHHHHRKHHHHHHHHHHQKHHHHHHHHQKPHHHRPKVHLPHIWKPVIIHHPGHRRCPAGFTLYGNGCFRNYQPPVWQPPVWRPPVWQPQPVRRSCPYGWTQHGARCFLFVNSGKNWDSAEHHCRIFGGHLASFHSYSELNFLRHLVYTRAWSFRNTWVGGTDRGHNRVWRWTDGSWYNFNRWYPGEPNNWFGREECMEINFRGSDGSNDEKCYASRPFICARHL